MVELSYQELLKTSSQYQSKLFGVLKELVKIPTMAYRDYEGIEKCASYLVDTFDKLGYQAKLYPTDPKGHPVVYAEKNVGAEKTLMFYHHYDIQPEDPLDKWETSPWEMTERDGRMYGRGTCDNKGWITISMFAMQMLEEQLGTLPVNVKFVIEGEEEMGSHHLPKFVNENPELMKADGCSWEHIGIGPPIDDPETISSPIVMICGLKGNAAFDLIAGGKGKFARTDVHSGQAGGIPNAAWRLSWALSSLKDKNENILIDGFNELIDPLDPEDIKILKDAGPEQEESMKDDYQLDRLLLDRTGYDLLEKMILNPTLTINGLSSGYQVEGSKMIIPNQAVAKIDFRLVPGVTMEKTEELLRKHLLKHDFNDIEVKFHAGYNTAKTPISHPFIRTLRKATEELVGDIPIDIHPLALGSGPAYLFTPYTPICLLASDIPGVNGHAPNENLPINHFGSSMAFNAYFAQYFALNG
ncbi:MAG: M20/M25/M40 family metallo-hydrolase [Candidatus Kariarchaeaceae archaeon]|jgi:acetylornithine deacetylase/succinyl-diaminopimelate desuccinylase-like protein